MRLLRISTVLAWALALSAAPLYAQSTYPSQTVKIVVGFVPGGATDQVARIVADGLTRKLGNSFVVENRPGASGNMAAAQVARAPGDGYTLLLSAVGLATTAAFNPSALQAHPTKDLAPIAMLAYTPNVLLAGPKTKVKTVPELLAYAKAHPGTLNFGHSGYGGGLHLTGATFAVRSGIRMEQVPYKGTAAMMQDLLGGQIELGFDNLSSAFQLVQSGKVTALAVTSKKRVPQLPQVPTLEELGFDNSEFGAWFGLNGPKALPPELARTIAKHVSEVLDDPKTKQQFQALGIQIMKSKSSAEFASYVDQDIARWRAVVARANIKPE